VIAASQPDQSRALGQPVAPTLGGKRRTQLVCGRAPKVAIRDERVELCGEIITEQLADGADSDTPPSV